MPNDLLPANVLNDKSDKQKKPVSRKGRKGLTGRHTALNRSTYLQLATLGDPMQERQPANQRCNWQPELNVSKYRCGPICRFVHLQSNHTCGLSRPRPVRAAPNFGVRWLTKVPTAPNQASANPRIYIVRSAKANKSAGTEEVKKGVRC